MSARRPIVVRDRGPLSANPRRYFSERNGLVPLWRLFSRFAARCRWVIEGRP